jgi:hypothetical protein
LEGKKKGKPMARRETRPLKLGSRGVFVSKGMEKPPVMDGFEGISLGHRVQKGHWGINTSPTQSSAALGEWDEFPDMRGYRQ